MMELALSNITEGIDFRLYLQSELVRRCKDNPQYSLRAFARQLQVSPSALSAMLRGKRSITDKTKRRFGVALNLAPHEISRLLAVEEPSNGPSYQQIALDSFAFISDWYHYAILELTQTDKFQPDTSWISRTLGISKSEANVAVERLLRMGLLEINGEGKWRDTSENGYVTNISGDLTTVASRRLQKQILELSLKALEKTPIEKRSHTSMTMAINPEDMPIAKKMIAAFRRALTKKLNQNQKPTEVYQLSVSLFPVTDLESGE